MTRKLFRRAAAVSALAAVLILLNVTLAAAQTPLLPTESPAQPALTSTSLQAHRAQTAGQHTFSFSWFCPETFGTCLSSVSHNIVVILPGGSVSFVSATPGKGSCSVTSATVSCNLGTFFAQENIVITMTVDHDATVEVFRYNAIAVSTLISQRIEVLDGTSSYGVQQLVNGGFETNPLGTEWNIKRPTGGRQICNRTNRPGGLPDKIVTPYGNCAFRFNPIGQTTLLTQAIEPIGVRGDAMWMGIHFRSKNLSGPARVRLIVTLSSGSKHRLVARIPANAPTWRAKSAQTTLFSTATKIRLKAEYAGTTGRVFIDDISVMYFDQVIFD